MFGTQPNQVASLSLCVSPGLGHHSGGLVQQLGLVVGVEGPSVGHIVQDVTANQAVAENMHRHSRVTGRRKDTAD